MIKVIGANKDSYITDKFVKGTRVTGSNVGNAATLDLFKLYDVTSSGSTALTELSRILIHFDLSTIASLYESRQIDITNGTFNVKLKLFDVYGGQPTPNNFVVNLYPLSKSFDEGIGRDIAYFSDKDVCNFMSASRVSGSWFMSGCAMSGGLPGQNGLIDYITASSYVNGGQSLLKQQTFVTGEEDLELDVTQIVSATLVGLLPDSGFRISYADSHETDQRTYFVKRFAAKNAYDYSKRPQLIMKYDDSIQDDSLSLSTDISGTLVFYNYGVSGLENLMSGTSVITGSNCVLLHLRTEVSGGYQEYVFTGSQHKTGQYYVSGVYSSSVYLSSLNSSIRRLLNESGSVKLTPIWSSLDNTVPFLTASKVYLFDNKKSTTLISQKAYVVNVHNVKERYSPDEQTIFRVNVFDKSSPSLFWTKLPIEHSGVSVRDMHYCIKDATTRETIISYDTVYNSTKLSSDTKGMFFKFDMSSLPKNRTYVIELMSVRGTERTVFQEVGQIFRVSEQ